MDVWALSLLRPCWSKSIIQGHCFYHHHHNWITCRGAAQVQTSSKATDSFDLSASRTPPHPPILPHLWNLSQPHLPTALTSNASLSIFSKPSAQKPKTRLFKTTPRKPSPWFPRWPKVGQTMYHVWKFLLPRSLKKVLLRVVVFIISPQALYAIVHYYRPISFLLPPWQQVLYLSSFPVWDPYQPMLWSREGDKKRQQLEWGKGDLKGFYLGIHWGESNCCTIHWEIYVNVKVQTITFVQFWLKILFFRWRFLLTFIEKF